MADAPGIPGLRDAPTHRRRLTGSGAHAGARAVPGAWLHQLLRLAPILAIAAVVAGGAWAWSAGWRVLVITTPSMSPALSVGAAVLTHPGMAHRGDVIAFHPPGDPHLYAHRVVQVLSGPRYRTKGDNNPLPDAWVIPASRVVGVVRAVVPGLGWLLRAMPILGACLAATAAAVLWASRAPRTQRPIGWLWPAGLAVGLAVSAWVLKPLVRIQEITATPAGLRAVNTGLLPLSTSGPGAHLTVAPGHLFQIPARGGMAAAHFGADVPIWAWAVVIAICLAPVASATWWTFREPGPGSQA